ncbi:hypothetical protein HBI56_125880 [Parastagonospora nodorum]|nr:hypothetical protein HBH51_129010 [Parastagonospora nodorum]KAH3997250.1 hypothetical protein HBI10_146530 [Parastagonospora nodorum]KAH4019924.1 hypothetical protein HBI13_119680 [Parastagonospora nodorum]KAH4076868.1 hypothetical protein HBH50_011630 [Parastagonospora nodorum]KAH4095653.1 hypothetical protein HBH48_046170 [Parastagonospora nodorum]
MLIQARWDELRQKMQVVKNAYVSRHYSQCAKYGERLLAEVQGEIHPIHLAYLNFYTALSHDTLAREATLKNRYKELSLAEKHYVAAVAALSPQEYTSDRAMQVASPTSSTSSHSPTEANVIWRFRRADSVSSTASFASSATSISSSRPDLDYTHRSMGSYSFPSPPQHFHAHAHTRKRSIIIPSRPQTPEEYQFAADTAAFVRMVRGHLMDVRTLKQATDAPSVRFRFSSDMSSPVKSRAGSRVFDGEMEEVKRRERKNMSWRPRFDPSETQRLCGEALAELGD